MVARPKVIVQQNNKKLIISSTSLNIQRRNCVVRNAMHCCAFADAFYCISGVVKCILAGDRVCVQRQSRRTVRQLPQYIVISYFEKKVSLTSGGTMSK